MFLRLLSFFPPRQYKSKHDNNQVLTLVLVFIGFAALMVKLVTICIKQDDIHLVVENYYEEEINYQQHIDKVQNTETLAHEVLIFDSQLKIVDLHLPLGAEGTLHLFRPSDARLDQKIPFHITDLSVNAVDVKGLKPGYWKVKLTWTEKCSFGHLVYVLFRDRHYTDVGGGGELGKVVFRFPQAALPEGNALFRDVYRNTVYRSRNGLGHPYVQSEAAGFRLWSRKDRDYDV